MTICNMSIEAGARAGLIAPDDTTFAYLEGRPAAPTGAEWEQALDALARACRRIRTQPTTASSSIDVARARAAGHVGHEPGAWSSRSTDRVPDPADFTDPDRRHGGRAGARLHGPRAGHADRRTSRSTASSSARARTPGSRICARPRRSSPASRSTRASAPWSCPARPRSSGSPRTRASTAIFDDAGFEWRRAGCSMCLGMNPDMLADGERCASTSNRNFEGRQGRGGRTHLVSPQLAAATAIAGHFVDPRELATTA